MLQKRIKSRWCTTVAGSLGIVYEKWADIVDHPAAVVTFNSGTEDMVIADLVTKFT
jgi:hypothetical protein